MGCGVSRADRRRMRSAYHGVVSPAVSSTHAQACMQHTGLTKSAASSNGTSHFSRFSGSVASDFEGTVFADEPVEQTRYLQRYAESVRKEAIPRKGGARKPLKKRTDNLLNFGRFHLKIVDELATAQVATHGAAVHRCAPIAAAGNPSPENGSNPNRTPASAACVGADLMLFQQKNTQPLSRSGRFTVSVCGSARKSRPPNAAVRGTEVNGFHVKPIGGHRGSVKFLLMSPCGDQLFSCAKESSRVRVYHLGLGCDVGSLGGDGFGVLVSGDVNANGQLVATASRDATVVVWDTTTRKLRLSLPHPKVVFCCRFDPTGTRLVTSCQDGLCREWNLASGQEVSSFTGCNRLVYALAYSSTGKHILCGGSDHHILVWRAQRTARHSGSSTTGCSPSDTLALTTDTIAGEGGTSDAVFTGHVGDIMNIVVRRQAGQSDDVVVSADKRLIEVWYLTTRARIASFDARVLRHGKACGLGGTSATAASPSGRVQWTAVNFAPSPFDKYILVATNKCTVRVLRFMPEDPSDAGAKPNPPQRPSPASSSPPVRTGEDSRTVVAAKGPSCGAGVVLPTNADRHMIRPPPRLGLPSSVCPNTVATRLDANAPPSLARKDARAQKDGVALDGDDSITLRFKAAVTSVFSVPADHCLAGSGGSATDCQRPSRCPVAALGDKCGNTYLLHLW